jgi:hypothetical protein
VPVRAIAPSSLRVTTSVGAYSARAAIAASSSSFPALAFASASLAKRISIFPSRSSFQKPSRWRATQKVSDRVKAT